MMPSGLWMFMGILQRRTTFVVLLNLAGKMPEYPVLGQFFYHGCKAHSKHIKNKMHILLCEMQKRINPTPLS